MKKQIDIKEALKQKIKSFFPVKDELSANYK